jgi:hypothetical protein
MASNEVKRQHTAATEGRIWDINKIHSLGQGSLISDLHTKIPFIYFLQLCLFFYYILLSYFLSRRKIPIRWQSIAATKRTPRYLRQSSMISRL